MGDPAGIGGEITAKAWRALAGLTGPQFAIVADPFWVGGLDVPMAVIQHMDQVADVFASALPVLALSLPEIARPGRPDPANAPAVIASIERAVALVQAGEAGAVVTNPISKAVLYQAGFPHPGHTEFLGELTGGTPVMMLACPQLRVVPVTIHVSLRRALDMLSHSADRGRGARDRTRRMQRDFGIAAPRLAVAGLNPHAGEDGAMGGEEIEMVTPGHRGAAGGGHRRDRPLPAGHDVHRCRAARPTMRRSACITTRR